MKITRYHTGPLAVNTYYVVDENTKKGFIVDPGGYDKALFTRVKEEDVTLEYVILTHGHYDHIGGVAALQREFQEVKLVASSRYSEDDETLAPDVCVDDADVLSVGGIKLHFFHTPGHTPGGICVLASGYLFSGDTLFQQSIGRTDFVGSSFKAIEKSIKEKLYTLPDDTIVLPGHMGETEIGFEKRNNPFVRD